jgi:hypothetical protein
MNAVYDKPANQLYSARNSLKPINTFFAESVLEVRVRKVSSPTRNPAPTNTLSRLRLGSAA